MEDLRTHLESFTTSSNETITTSEGYQDIRLDSLQHSESFECDIYTFVPVHFLNMSSEEERLFIKLSANNTTIASLFGNTIANLLSVGLWFNPRLVYETLHKNVEENTFYSTEKYHHYMWFIYLKHEFIGVVWLESAKLKCEDYLELTCALIPKYRGYGIASKIGKQLLHHPKFQFALDGKKLALTTLPENNVVKRLASKLGFQYVKTIIYPIQFKLFCVNVDLDVYVLE